MDGYQVERHQAGDLVFREGDAGDRAYLVLSGRVAVVRETEDGTIPLAEYGERQIFGELVLLDAAARTATAQVVEDGQLVTIPADAFNAQLERTPPVIRTVLRSLATQLQTATARLQPERDKSLFFATAHLLYQMNLALKSDGTHQMPHDRAMGILQAVLGRSEAEIEAVLRLFADLNLLSWHARGGRPQLVFLVREGFLGKALHFYDQWDGEPEATALEAESLDGALQQDKEVIHD